MGKKKKKTLIDQTIDKTVDVLSPVVLGTMLVPAIPELVKEEIQLKKEHNKRAVERRNTITNYKSGTGTDLKRLANTIDISRRIINIEVENRLRKCKVLNCSLEDYIKDKNEKPMCVIVSETDSDMSPQGWLRKKAGNEIEKDCTRNKPYKIGKTLLIDSYKLKSNNVIGIIFFSSPRYYSEISRSMALGYIRKGCRDSLNKAKKMDCKCVVFPDFSINDRNTRGHNSQSVANAVMSEIHTWMCRNPKYGMRVIICAGSNSEKYRIAKENVSKSIVPSNSLAIVFPGGGAKGAFQFGAWEMLRKKGITDKITGFSGTSIGAVNTLLCVAPGSAKRKAKLWTEFTEEDFKHDYNQSVLQNKINNFLDEVGEETFNDIVDRYDIFTTIYDMRSDEVYINWRREGFRGTKKLIADSANHPLLYFMNLSNRLDGGTLDSIRKRKAQFGIELEPDVDMDKTNDPIQPLYDIGYRNFIIVYLNERDIELEKAEKLRYGGARFFRIYPKSSLGDMDKIVDKKKGITTESRILKGKLDTLRFLKT